MWQFRLIYDVVIFLIREMLQEYQVMPYCLKRIMQYMERAKQEAKKIGNVSIKRALVDICDYALVHPIKNF
ncbi:unnamed protein product [marine sediment metagenome]|uniref:Uncharacterized protein n=1 Tax=marine sediment metagenome TaxID=412755 RepID=X1PUE9_9ZZZZ